MGKSITQVPETEESKAIAQLEPLRLNVTAWHGAKPLDLDRLESYLNEHRIPVKRVGAGPSSANSVGNTNSQVLNSEMLIFSVIPMSAEEMSAAAAAAASSGAAGSNSSSGSSSTSTPGAQGKRFLAAAKKKGEEKTSSTSDSTAQRSANNSDDAPRSKRTVKVPFPYHATPDMPRHLKQTFVVFDDGPIVAWNGQWSDLMNVWTWALDRSGVSDAASRAPTNTQLEVMSFSFADDIAIQQMREAELENSSRYDDGSADAADEADYSISRRTLRTLSRPRSSRNDGAESTAQDEDVPPRIVTPPRRVDPSLSRASTESNKSSSYQQRTVEVVDEDEPRSDNIVVDPSGDATLHFQEMGPSAGAQRRRPVVKPPANDEDEPQATPRDTPESVEEELKRAVAEEASKRREVAESDQIVVDPEGKTAVHVQEIGRDRTKDEDAEERDDSKDPKATSTPRPTEEETTMEVESEEKTSDSKDVTSTTEEEPRAEEEATTTTPTFEDATEIVDPAEMNRLDGDDDLIVLANDDPEHKVPFSSALALSVKLDLVDVSIRPVALKVKKWQAQVGEKGDVQCSLKNLRKAKTELLSVFADLNFRHGVHTTPKLFWAGEFQRFRPAYKELCEHLEVEERLELLDNKMETLDESLTYLHDEVHANSNEHLTLVIIYLIVIEIVVALDIHTYLMHFFVGMPLMYILQSTTETAPEAEGSPSVVEKGTTTTTETQTTKAPSEKEKAPSEAEKAPSEAEKALAESEKTPPEAATA